MRVQIVSFHCVLSSRIGKVLSSTFNQDVITQGASQGDLLQGLADGLQDLKKGEKRQIRLSADQAYGFYDPRLVIEMPRNKLLRGHALQLGDEVPRESRTGELKIFRVIQATHVSVMLDGNHPLAGQDLVFDIEATEARDATQGEIAESCVGETHHYLH